MMTTGQRFSILAAALALGLGGQSFGASAEDATKLSLTLKDHKFSPAEPAAPAGKPVVIELENQDKTPAEFESKALRFEKVVPGGGKITVQVRALPPGRYRFFDDYHESTTEGFLVTQ
jgi:Cupredoxin-like domain